MIETMPPQVQKSKCNYLLVSFHSQWRGYAFVCGCLSCHSQMEDSYKGKGEGIVTRQQHALIFVHGLPCNLGFHFFAVYLARLLFFQISLQFSQKHVLNTTRTRVIASHQGSYGWMGQKMCPFIIAHLGHCSGWRQKAAKLKYSNSGPSLSTKDKIPKA